MKLGYYNRTVRHYLVKNHNWEGKKATDWISNNPDYMRAMWESLASPEETAEFIAKMKEE